MKRVIICFFLLIFEGQLFAQKSVSGRYTEFSESEYDTTFQHCVGSAAIFIKNNQVEFETYRGFKNVEFGALVDSNTLFKVASLSKVVSTLGLMKLVEQGKLNLDEDISTYLGFKLVNPYWPNDKITLKMILSHTSSIQDVGQFDQFLLATRTHPNNPPDLKDLLLPNHKYFNKYLWLRNRPGTYFQYSNMAFGLIGAIIENVSNKRFDIFMKENLFKPLELNASYNVFDLQNQLDLSNLYLWRPHEFSIQLNEQYYALSEKFNCDFYPIGKNGYLFPAQSGLRITAKGLQVIMGLFFNNGESFALNSRKKVIIFESKTIDTMCKVVWQYPSSIEHKIGNGNTQNGLFMQWALGLQNTNLGYSNDSFYLGHKGVAYGLFSGFYFNRNTQNGCVFIINGSEYGYRFDNNSPYFKHESFMIDWFKKIEKSIQK